MKIGNKIFELRKKACLSQEQLAEKLNVTRQTISKWELDETKPDIEQAKILSQIFNISLDELVDNNIKEPLVEKVSNTEKLAGIIIKILKAIGLIFLVLLIIDIVALIAFSILRNNQTTKSITEEIEISCIMNEQDYLITIDNDGYFNCDNCSKKLKTELNSYVNFNDLDGSLENIEEYFLNHNGNCD